MAWFVDLKEEDLFLDDVATVWCDFVFLPFSLSKLCLGCELIRCPAIDLDLKSWIGL